MGTLANILGKSVNSAETVNADIWAWCPWCGIRQWMLFKVGDVYECKHCHNEHHINIRQPKK